MLQGGDFKRGLKLGGHLPICDGMKFDHILKRFSAIMLLAGFAVLVLVGCHNPAQTTSRDESVISTNSNVATNDPGEPTEAQPKLPTVKLYVGAAEMDAELCTTPREVQTGMMFRKTMGTNDGMLFTLFYPQRASFWMKNCYIPLSVAYIGPDGVIEEIHPLQVMDITPVLSATNNDNIQFALETPQGWFDAHHVTTGMVVRTERGSLQDTFGQR